MTLLDAIAHFNLLPTSGDGNGDGTCYSEAELRNWRNEDVSPFAIEEEDNADGFA